MRFARLWIDVKSKERTLYCRSCHHGHKLQRVYWRGLLVHAVVRCPKVKGFWYAVDLVNR